MNEGLTERIIEKAHQLWSKSGEEAVTLRAVARAAKTTTPSVYSRFPTKEDLIAAVADRVRLEMAGVIIRSKTARAGCEAYLELAAHRQREYHLLFGPAWGKVYRKDRPRPGVEWVMRQLADQHGGDPDQYLLTAHALWYLLHGAASLLQYVSAGAAADELRGTCLAACDAIISHPLKAPRKRQRE